MSNGHPVNQTRNEPTQELEDEGPTILERECPNAPPMPLIVPEDSEDEFGRRQPIRMASPPARWTQRELRPDCYSGRESFCVDATLEIPTENGYTPIVVVSSALVDNDGIIQSTRSSSNHHHTTRTRRNSSSSSCHCAADSYHPVNSFPRLIRSSSNTRQVHEMVISNAVTQEIEGTELQRQLVTSHLELNTLLEHIVQHLECITLESRSLGHFCTLIERMRPPLSSGDFNLSSTLRHLSDPSRYEYYWMKRDIQSILSQNVTLDQVISDFRVKKSELGKAIYNMRMALDNSYSNSQIDKLRKHFDLVYSKFQKARRQLQRKLNPSLVDRKELLINVYGVLGEDMQRYANERSDFAVVSQYLESGLRSELAPASPDTLPSY